MSTPRSTPPAALVAPPKSTAREYFESIVIAVILALFVRTWCFQAFKIPTGSMENNLLIGDHLVVNKFLFAPAGFERALLPIRDFRRGDVVVFKWPGGPERDFIKRVVALPGETVELRHKKVYINGTPLDEPYVHYLQPSRGDNEFTAYDKRETYAPVTVPAGQLFVMGDNRDNSMDSRFPAQSGGGVGLVPADLLVARASAMVWSTDGSAEWIKPWTWFSAARWDRFGKGI